MKGSYTLLVVAVAGIAVGALLTGNTLISLAPLLLIAGCAVMMLLMMRGMGHGGHESGSANDSGDQSAPTSASRHDEHIIR